MSYIVQWPVEHHFQADSHIHLRRFQSAALEGNGPGLYGRGDFPTVWHIDRRSRKHFLIGADHIDAVGKATPRQRLPGETNVLDIRRNWYNEVQSVVIYMTFANVVNLSRDAWK